MSTVVLRPLANESSANSATSNSAGTFGNTGGLVRIVNPQATPVLVTVASYVSPTTTANYASFTVLANSETFVLKNATDNFIVNSAANVQVLPVAYRSL